MHQIKLSNKYSIVRLQYNQEYTRQEFLRLIRYNHENTIHTNNNSVWIEIDSPVFDTVNNQVKKTIETISGRKFIHHAHHNWVYTQRKGFDMEWMHQHVYVHPPGRSKIHTDYTFTFYLQTADEAEGDEGMIVFEDENKIRHKFLPKEGDIFIFPADIRHTAIPTPKSDRERIVFAGSYCLDIFNQKSYEKSII